ncbi:MAG: cytochrome b N-terminal domain-containing protein [Deltaproteobacteria bacterium]|nr:cytochrome b N-terminal domain-containing protein [Deltaproteobacteria bacterium]
MIFPPRPSKIDQFKAWLEDRTGLGGALASLMNQPVPGGASLWRALGMVAALLVGLEFVTGVLLAFYYAPSAATAWASTAFIEDQLWFGSLIRGVHSFGSIALIVVSGLHLVQVVLFGAYKRPREANWIAGLLLLLVLLGFALSGYGLPWDQAGYWAKFVETSILSTTPVVGPMLEAIVQGGSRYGHYTVIHFYAVHVFILPAALALLLTLHIYWARRHKLTPPWWMDPATVSRRTEPYFPGQALRDLSLFAFALAVVVVFVVVKKGAGLEPPADPASNYMARPEWYAIPLYQLRMYFEGPLEIVATMIIPGIVGALVFALPFLDRSHSLSPWKRPLATGGLVAALVITAVLTTLSVRKDRADVAFQKHRAEVALEGLRARDLAKRGVLPTGGIDVFKNDPQFEVLSLYKEKCGNCHGLTGQGGDEGPDFADYNSRSWIVSFLKDPQGPLFMGPAKKKKGMKPVEGTDEELAALAEVVYAQTGAKDVKPELLKKAKDSDLFSEKDCDSCHYIDEGDKDLGNAGPSLFQRGTIDYVVRVIEAPDHETLYGEKAKMPGFKGKLTPEQIRLLAEFIVGMKKPSATAAAN